MKTFDLVYIGRIVRRQKRIDKLYEFIREANNCNINFRAHIFGNGEENWKQRLGLLNNVSLYGYLARWWDHAPPNSIFISFADYEGCPLSLIEFSKYCGNRFMVLNNNGLRQYVSENCIFNDPQSIIDSLLEECVPTSSLDLSSYWASSDSLDQCAKILDAIAND